MSLEDTPMLRIEVVYATQLKQFIQEVQMPSGVTIEDGIRYSGILNECPAIDLSINKVGIHGVIKPLTTELRDGDRIEIYRSIEPK